jgi:hypothetical protein
MAEVQRAIGIGQGVGDEQATTHGRQALRNDFALLHVGPAVGRLRGLAEDIDPNEMR